MDTPLLQLSQITKSFGAVRALRGITFDLYPGEVHALLGENGAGKSTLIKVITGAHPPDSGTVQIGGITVERLNPALARSLGIAAIYQQPALFPDLSVAENIALRLEPGAFGRRVDWPRRRNCARQLLHGIGADIDPEVEARRLSMPEQQLVEIACALGARARIVIMDEPTASLTQQEQQLLFAVVRDLRSSGVGIIYISHRLEEIFALADRVTVLRDGETVGTRLIRSDEGHEARCSANSDQNFSRRATTISEGELIKLMVGRDVSTIYPPAEGKPGNTLLSLRGVGCRASAIHDINLDVRTGEVLGLAGLMGAGRTELARILFGITPADSGTIVLDGRERCIRSPREAVEAGIGYVPEDRRRHGIILEMPVAANITMGIHPRLFPGSWLRIDRERQLALDYIRDLSIKTPSPENKAAHLSGGNQQKVALARWLASEPKVLILDEPTQGVDVGAKAEIHKLIRRLAGRGLAVLMISSDLPEVLGMSDRIAVMRGGTIAAVLDGQTADAPVVMAAALGQMDLKPRGFAC